MFDINQLPVKISKRLNGLKYKTEKIGMSGADIFVFDDKVLKIENTCPESDRESAVISWLNNKLPVPHIIEFDKSNGKNFLLMSKLEGEMACSENNMNSVENMVKALADGLKMLWNIDIKGCPFQSRLESRLIDAKYNIEHHLVDVDDAEEETFGENGFKDVKSLYDFLITHKPEEDLVFTHGDYCLPNVFMQNDTVTGFLDLGKAGIADRWQDIALCIRSLKHNICDYYGKSESDFEEAKEFLYSQLGITEDKQKLGYYILLDELF
ncbi:MAG: aminoglycoside 3'-phosphotransferase [Eubacterium sp.]|nr:aminoglycoside 3'-phosphotransferase [Eubacterium sp.]